MANWENKIQNDTVKQVVKEEQKQEEEQPQV